MPSSSQVSSLRIGAVKPGVLCTSCSGAVKAYGDITDPETVLEYQGRFYKNKEVVVLVGDTFEFRNPPAFVTLDKPRREGCTLRSGEPPGPLGVSQQHRSVHLQEFDPALHHF